MRRSSWSVVLPVLLVAAWLPACPRPADGGDGIEGEGEGDGDAAGDRPTLAASCSDGVCGAGLACVDLGVGEDDSDTAACFAVCAVVGDECTTASARPGVCTAVEGDALVCVATSSNLEGCGNRANAACGDRTYCAAIDVGVRTCVRPCDPANPSSCLLGGDACGCADEEVCASFIRLQSGDQICAPQAGPGATCGVEPNGDIHPCTEGVCRVQSSPWPGRCG
jgi:hypothetical protein